MATIESLAKRLDDLDHDRGYFSIEEIVSANAMNNESLIDAVQREHPFKTFNPAMLRDLLGE